MCESPSDQTGRHSKFAELELVGNRTELSLSATTRKIADGDTPPNSPLCPFQLENLIGPPQSVRQNEKFICAGLLAACLHATRRIARAFEPLYSKNRGSYSPLSILFGTLAYTVFSLSRLGLKCAVDKLLSIASESSTPGAAPLLLTNVAALSRTSLMAVCDSEGKPTAIHNNLCRQSVSPLHTIHSSLLAHLLVTVG
jgi:hypothetical protein